MEPSWDIVFLGVQMSQVVRKSLIVLKWLVLLVPLSIAIGSVSAFFLWSLDTTTSVRLSHSWLLFLLPLGGFLVGLIYHLYGGAANRGNNLLIDEVHEPGAGVPRRLAPLILIGTLLTHLFGGSAGREGTAVQMGGGMAATYARWLRLDAGGLRILLMAGVAAGFGSVFGAPVAGTVFALEVLIIGRIQYDALIPCFAAALMADWVAHAWGIHHTSYQVAVATAAYHTDLILLGKVILAGGLFGLAGRLFVISSHQTSALFKRFLSYPPARPAVGGVIIIILFFIVGTPDYLGIGTFAHREGAITLPAMFTGTDIPASAWIWKLIFTVITLSSGMKGGEVTPLFFIGAALGNALSSYLGVPVDLMAALGFVAIFAGATNTPLASLLLGAELFGAGNIIYIAAACLVAYGFSGHAGIYSSQKFLSSKFQGFAPDK